MDFKAGDKVKLARTDGEWDWYKEHLGETFTIKKICEDWSGKKFAELEENNELMPFIKNLELAKEKYTYEDLKKAPIGTKVTFYNNDVFIKSDKHYITRFEGISTDYNLINICGNSETYKIIKIEEPEYKTVYECKPEILDNTEKRYLKDVIRPFRDKVQYICKYHSSAIDEECVYIHIPNNPDIILPYFKEDSMYKGMELGKEYTLEELGI